MTDAVSATNRLLFALPAGEAEALRPDLETVPLAVGQILHEPHRAAGHAWFLGHGVVSLLTPMQGGAQVEAVHVGPEGVVGLALVLGAGATASQAVVRVPGEAARIAAEPFRRALGRSPGLRRLLARYALARMEHMAQHGACVRLHAVEGRLASRLLLVQDAVHGAASFPLTQGIAARMLGARRPTVSAAAARLQRAGFIAYVRGTITVLDRPGLEAASCGCHRAVRDGFDRMHDSRG